MNQPQSSSVRLHIFCCTNNRGCGHPKGSCGERGSEELYRYFKTTCRSRGFEDVRVNSTSCMGFCKFGPTVVVYPEGVWYSCKSTIDIDAIIDSHIIKGDVCEHLLLKPVA